MEKIEFANGQHFAERKWKEVEGDIRIFTSTQKRILLGRWSKQLRSYVGSKVARTASFL
jgi:hypothetical protein